MLERIQLEPVSEGSQRPPPQYGTNHPDWAFIKSTSKIMSIFKNILLTLRGKNYRNMVKFTYILLDLSVSLPTRER